MDRAQFHYNGVQPQGTVFRRETCAGSSAGEPVSDFQTIAAKLQQRRRLAGWKEVDPRPAPSRSFGEVWETWFLNYPTVTLLLVATFFIYACILALPIFVLLK